MKSPLEGSRNLIQYCRIIYLSTDEDFVVVSVKDSGKGIKKEDQGKLLRPNTHFTSYGTNNEKGSGLGLMLCKDFVEQLGGKLWFDSEDGKGTTFYFSLKVSNQE